MDVPISVTESREFTMQRHKGMFLFKAVYPENGSIPRDQITRRGTV